MSVAAPRARQMYRTLRRGGRLEIKSNSPRDIYNYLRKMFPNRNVVSESYLRLEKLGTTANVLSFDVLDNEGNPRPTERRLSVADDFVATHVGLAFIGSAENQTEYGEKPLLSYPNSNTMLGADDVLFANQVYNGYLAMRKNSVVIFDSIDTSQFRFVGTAQQGVDSATGSAYVDSSWNRGTPYAPLTPGLILSGDAKNQIQLQIPPGGNPLEIFTTVVVLFRGFLIQGATTV